MLAYILDDYGNAIQIDCITMQYRNTGYSLEHQ